MQCGYVQVLRTLKVPPLYIYIHSVFTAKKKEPTSKTASLLVVVGGDQNGRMCPETWKIGNPWGGKAALGSTADAGVARTPEPPCS